MGTSIHRIITITVIIKLLLVISTFMANNYASYDLIDNSLSSNKENWLGFKEQYPTDSQDSNSNYIDEVFGNIKSGTRLALWNPLRNGILWSDSSWARGELEVMLMKLFNIFGWIINGLLFLEVILFIYTKKNT